MARQPLDLPEHLPLEASDRNFHFCSISLPASFRHCTLPAACSVEVDDHSPRAFSPLRSRRAGSHERR